MGEGVVSKLRQKSFVQGMCPDSCDNYGNVLLYCMYCIYCKYGTEGLREDWFYQICVPR